MRPGCVIMLGTIMGLWGDMGAGACMWGTVPSCSWFMDGCGGFLAAVIFRLSRLMSTLLLAQTPAAAACNRNESLGKVRVLRPTQHSTLLVSLVQFRGSGLLVLKYFQFFAPNTHCALAVALLKKKYHSAWLQEMGSSCTCVLPNTRALEQQG